MTQAASRRECGWSWKRRCGWQLVPPAVETAQSGR